MERSLGRIWLITNGTQRLQTKFMVLADRVQQEYPDADVLLLLLEDTNRHSIFRFINNAFQRASEGIEGFQADLKFYLFDHRMLSRHNLLSEFYKNNNQTSVALLRNLIHLNKYFETGEDDSLRIHRSVNKSRRFNFLIKLKIYMLVVFYFLFAVLQRRKRKPLAEIKKILIVKFDVFGDMVVALPYLKAIREAFPCAETSLLASRKGIAYVESYRKVAGELPFNQLIAWDAPWHYRGVTKLGLKDFFLTLKKALDLRKKDYDLVIQCREHGISVWFSLMVARGSLFSIYDSRLPLSRLLSKFIDKRIDVSCDAIYHMVDFPKLLLSDIEPTVEVDDNYLETIIPAGGFAVPWEGEGTPKILVNVGAGMALRRWNSEKYAELIRTMQQRLSVVPVLLCGPDELSVYDEIVHSLPGKVLGYRGNLSLAEVAQVVAQADIVITPDTGVMHLAAACDKKILAIFGAGEVEFCRPLGDKCIIVRKELGCSGCGDSCFQHVIPPPCLDLITVEDMLQGLISLVER